MSRRAFSDACPSRPTMMWSCTVTPSGLAIAMISRVIATSWAEGEGSPEGWLWTSKPIGTGLLIFQVDSVFVIVVGSPIGGAKE
jgi:hypothetical protein